MDDVQTTNNKTVNCVREVLNFSMIGLSDRFDKKTFNPDALLKKLPVYSPKIVALLNKIDALDTDDYEKEGKLFKHYIFSDIRRGYGAKILASAFIAAGYNIAINHKGTNIIVDEKVISNNSYSNFFVLSSTSIWETNPSTKNTKEIIKSFNSKKNIHGKLCRFIILDSGFKEGIDLFDVKYAHIFEEQMNSASLTQAVGRGTRFCGQSNLNFIPGKGWGLNVFVYKIYKKPTNFIAHFLSNKTIIQQIKDKDLGIKFDDNFRNGLTFLLQSSAVDSILNKNINEYEGNINILKKYIKKYKDIVIPVKDNILSKINFLLPKRQSP